MITWNMTASTEEERAAQEIAERLSEATGVRMSRAAAIRWAVVRMARRLAEDPEDLS